MSQRVSITLQNTDAARPIIEAIAADNPGVSATEMPGCVKLDREGSLVIKRASVERLLGREWDPQEIHLTLVSLAGNLDEDDDSFSLSWSR